MTDIHRTIEGFNVDRDKALLRVDRKGRVYLGLPAGSFVLVERVPEGSDFPNDITVSPLVLERQAGSTVSTISIPKVDINDLA